jgi:hypothetical protein
MACAEQRRKGPEAGIGAGKRKDQRRDSRMRQRLHAVKPKEGLRALGRAGFVVHYFFDNTLQEVIAFQQLAEKRIDLSF